MTPTDLDALLRDATPLVERLRAEDRLPFCPYDRRSPEYWTTPDDKPCKVCGTLNDSSAPDLCNGTGSRIMREAADTIEALRAKCEELLRCCDAETDARAITETNLEAAEAHLAAIATYCTEQAAMAESSKDRWALAEAQHLKYIAILTKGSRPMDIPQNERERFEAWAKTKFYNVTKAVVSPGLSSYVDETTCDAWSGWQAALLATRTAPAGYVVVPEEPTGAMLNAGIGALSTNAAKDAMMTAMLAQNPGLMARAKMEFRYAAMLAARPPLPGAGGPTGELVGCATPTCENVATFGDDDGEPRCESCIQGIIEEAAERETLPGAGGGE